MTVHRLTSVLLFETSLIGSCGIRLISASKTLLGDSGLVCPELYSEVSYAILRLSSANVQIVHIRLYSSGVSPSIYYVVALKDLGGVVRLVLVDPVVMGEVALMDDMVLMD